MGDPFEEEETEQSVTIDEYINNLESEELEADLILGGDEGKECTYTIGYMKRQAIFSCLTCCPGGNAGVCQACCLSCHDGHEIVELWTKRNFRCDCGNSKFGEAFCKLQPSKDVENVLNSYNHNFKGLYCTCGRPYPDPNVEEQEEMIQCIICEDWFHEEHLGLESSSEIPRNEDNEPIYEDFICKACVGVCSFLMLYPSSIQATGKQLIDSATNVSKEKKVMDEIPSAGGSGKVMNDPSSDGSLGKSSAVADANCSSGKAFDSGESSERASTQRTEDGGLHVTCPLDGNGVVTAALESKPMFLSGGWRDILCRCEKCLGMYKQKGVSYLLDKEDSIAEYEKMAKQRREEKLRQREGDASNFLDGLGHVEKIEMLSAIEDFKDEFRSFLENFDSSKAVTSSDINQIFTNLANKRRRTQ